ncbi:MAG: hypothetical protein AAGB31_16615, partial [Bdellovibrio sp.]
MIHCKLIAPALSFILFFLFIKSGLAYTPQRGNIHTIFGPYIFKTNYDSEYSQGYNSDSFAWIILGDVNDRGSLEISTLFMNKMYYLRQDGYLLAEKAQVVHVAAGYRYWFDKRWSASLSLYTSYPLGDSEKIYNNFPAAQATSTSAQENSETGLDIGLQGEIWSSGRYALVLETRYSWALTKKHNEFSDQYGALLG